MLSARGLSKKYDSGAGPLTILDGASLELARGDAVCVLGPSGSGKSTLLFILGALEPPTAGQVTLGGQDPFALSEAARAAFRNRNVGFVFQDHCLLPQCSVLENVLLPAVVAPPGDHEARARALLDQVGLKDRLAHRPGELSGGERQRTALARALVLSPTLLLCDEPTGNLDRDTGAHVIDLLFDLNRQAGTTMVIATHDLALAERAHRVVHLAGGRIERIETTGRGASASPGAP
jgi:lipoprotein-releasing system ATP-binding protein